MIWSMYGARTFHHGGEKISLENISNRGELSLSSHKPTNYGFTASSSHEPTTHTFVWIVSLRNASSLLEPHLLSIL